MGQHDVLDWLTYQRTVGNHKFFTTEEIAKGLKTQDQNTDLLRMVRYSMPRLLRFDMVEHRLNGKVWNWQRVYRAKKEILKE
jgi:hypothetical protein